MKILITGANGFVGCRVARFLGMSHQVVALSSKDLDITDTEAVYSTVMEHLPKAIIHLAALSSPAYCQQNPEDSKIVNVEGTINVARAAAAVGAKMIFASSDQVYGGLEGEEGFAEDEVQCPTTIYGLHKLAAENEMLSLLPNAVALRLTWMYDIPVSPLRQNEGILIKLMEAAKNNQPLEVSTQEYRGITHVWEVVRRIEGTIGLPGGVYNFGSTNDVSSFDTYRAAAQFLMTTGFIEMDPHELVQPSESFKRNINLSIHKLERFGLTFPSSIAGLRNALLHSV